MHDTWYSNTPVPEIGVPQIRVALTEPLSLLKIVDLVFGEEVNGGDMSVPTMSLLCPLGQRSAIGSRTWAGAKLEEACEVPNECNWFVRMGWSQARGGLSTYWLHVRALARRPPSPLADGVGTW